MIEFIVECVESIIVAMIFVIIIEMLLPNGANKKYVKMVSGIYLMFTILNPFLGLFNKDFDINLFENSNSIETSSSISNDSLKEYYISSLKSTIKSELESKGYNIKEIILNLNNDNSEILNITIKGASTKDFEEIKTPLVKELLDTGIKVA